MPRSRLLGVLLCYNDADILEENLDHLLANKHDVIVWNHGSTDDTAAILERRRGELLEVTHISRGVDFYDLYPLMSKRLRDTYVARYDWISWPDQDELLEGPDRTRPYHAFLEEAIASRDDWIEFRDLIFWFTERDDPAIASPGERIRHYALARLGAPKIRSWRASVTNVRWFNHNTTAGRRHPRLFNLRHYPMRSAAHLQRRLAVDRAGLQRGPVNAHYEHMKSILSTLDVRADDLHYDDGRAELNPTMTFDWTRVYGCGPSLPPPVAASFVLSTRRWEIAATVQQALGRLPAAAVSRLGRGRLDRWLAGLEAKISDPMVIALKRHLVEIVTEDAARDWPNGAAIAEQAAAPSFVGCARATIGALPVLVFADAGERSVRIVAADVHACCQDGHAPFVALVPCYDGREEPRVQALDGGIAVFTQLKGVYYYLTSEPPPACPL